MVNLEEMAPQMQLMAVQTVKNLQQLLEFFSRLEEGTPRRDGDSLLMRRRFRQQREATQQALMALQTSRRWVWRGETTSEPDGE